jgi:integrase/recombinase XerD
MKLADLATAFLGATAHTFQPNTRLAYGYDLGLFSRAFPDLDITAVTPQHLRAFLHDTADLAPSTLARRQATLRSCFGWAVRNELLPADPTAKLDPIKVPARDPRPLTEDQVAAILAAIPATEPRNRLLFTLLYETGMRVGEALGITRADLALNPQDGGVIRLMGKGQQERVIPLIAAPQSLRLLRALLKQQPGMGPLFRGDAMKGGHPGDALHRTTVFYHFERYVVSAQARYPERFADEAEPITIHRLRHTYATLQLRDGVSLPTLRKLMGHKNLQTTLRYAEIDVDQIKTELVAARRRRRS